jgi:hypothetical protein
LSLANTCTIDFVTTGFSNAGGNGFGLPLTTPVPSLTVVSNMAAVSIPNEAIPKACRPISNNLILDPVFYNSGDPEFKDPLGQSIILNTIYCDNYKFSYSKSVIALKISDNSNVIITNFPTPINGPTTSGDYLSVFTTSYENSPYAISVVLTVTLPEQALIYISKTVYLNAYL